MATLRVEVLAAAPRVHQAVTVTLAAGATVRDALAAAGVAAGRGGVGIFGERVSLETRLADGDRVELYRPLALDPKEARRRRARPQR